MCKRTQIWGIILAAIGAGLIISSFFAGVAIRVFLGILLIGASLIIGRH